MRFRLLPLLLLGVVAPLTAQEEPYPWRTSRFPWLSLTPGDGAMLHYRVIRFQQAADSSRVSLRASWGLDGGYSTGGSSELKLRGEFPQVAQGWRVSLNAGWSDQRHFGGSSLDQQWRGYGAGFDLTRMLHQRLLLSFRTELQHLDLTLGCAAATLTIQSPVPVECTEPLEEMRGKLSENDINHRISLVWDLRDREYQPSHGVLLEGGLFTGTAAAGYQGGYGLAQGWASPYPGLVLSARAGYRGGMGQTDAVGIRYRIPAWEADLPVLGGAESMRGLAPGERVGRSLTLAGTEVQQEIVSRASGLVGISLVAFADGGRAWDPARASQWEWSGGGGVRLRLLKATQLTLTVASHPGGGVRWYLAGRSR